MSGYFQTTIYGGGSTSFYDAGSPIPVGGSGGYTFYSKPKTQLVSRTDPLYADPTSWLSGAGQQLPVLIGDVRVPCRYIVSSAVSVTSEVIYQTARDFGEFDTETIIISDNVVLAEVEALLLLGIPMEVDADWQLVQLWADDLLILDRRNTASAFQYDGLSWNLYSGKADQAVPAEAVSIVGAAASPAYRGRITLGIKLNLEYFGGRPPTNIEARIISDTTQTEWYDLTEINPSFPKTGGVAWDSDSRVIYWLDDGLEQDAVRAYYEPLREEIFANYIPDANFYDPDLFVPPAVSDQAKYLQDAERLFYLYQDPVGLTWFPVIIDPTTGQSTAWSSSSASFNLNTRVIEKFAVSRYGQGYLFATLAIGLGGWVTVYYWRIGDQGRVGEPDTLVRIATGGANSTDEAIWFGPDGRLFVGTTTGVNEYIYDPDLIDVVQTATVVSFASYGKLVVGGHWNAAGSHYWHWFNDQTWAKYLAADNSLVWSASSPNSGNVVVSNVITRSELNDRSLVLPGSQFCHYDLNTGATDLWSYGGPFLPSVGNGMWLDSVQAYVDQNDFSTARINYYATLAPGTRALSEAVISAGKFAGLEAAEINASDLTDQINGVVLESAWTYQAFLQNLRLAFDFDILDAGGTILCQKPDPATINVALGASELVGADTGQQTLVATTRVESAAVPRQVEIEWIDPEREFTFNSIAPASLPRAPIGATDSDETQRIRIPVSMDGDAVARLQYKALYNIQAAQNSYQLRVPASQLQLEPGDVVTFPVGDRTVRGRVVAASMDASKVQALSIIGVPFATNVNIAADSGSGQGSESLAAQYSVYLHLDVPLLKRSENQTVSLMQYAAVAPKIPISWDFGYVYNAAVGDAFNLFIASDVSPVFGATLNVLPAHDPARGTDTSSSLTVRIYGGDTSQLASVSELERIEGTNRAAVGRAGRWEIVYFQNATNNGDGTWTFDTFSRGCLGSEQNTGNHGSDFFVLLNDTAPVFTKYFSEARVGEIELFKALGKNQSLAGVEITSHQLTGVPNKPYAPTRLTAVIDGADIDVGWTRRDRLAPDDIAATPPMSETSQLYRVRIYDGASNLVRTVTVAGATAWTYTAADIAADLGSMPASLQFDVAQVGTFDSGATITGYVAAATITL